jgi:hypothetical protein
LRRARRTVERIERSWWREPLKAALGRGAEDGSDERNDDIGRVNAKGDDE